MIDESESERASERSRETRRRELQNRFGFGARGPEGTAHAMRIGGTREQMQSCSAENRTVVDIHMRSLTFYNQQQRTFRGFRTGLPFFSDRSSHTPRGPLVAAAPRRRWPVRYA